MSDIDSKIKICDSYNEYNELLSTVRPSNAVVIAGMYNSYVDRILIGDNNNQGKIWSIVGGINGVETDQHYFP